MANCKETIRELDSFLDDELDPKVRAHIFSHLGECHDCLEAFEFEAELKQAIRRKCSHDEMPAGLMSRIEECLHTDIDGDGFIGTPPT